MRTIVELLPGLPLPVRWSVVCAAVTGMLGGLIGVIVGLRTYAPTAWFAVLEAGIPAGLIGALIGLAAGTIVAVAHRISR